MNTGLVVLSVYDNHYMASFYVKTRGKFRTYPHITRASLLRFSKVALRYAPKPSVLFAESWHSLTFVFREAA